MTTCLSRLLWNTKQFNVLCRAYCLLHATKQANNKKFFSNSCIEFRKWVFNSVTQFSSFYALSGEKTDLLYPDTTQKSNHQWAQRSLPIRPTISGSVHREEACKFATENSKMQAWSSIPSNTSLK
jgi:hypothetical protein